MKISLSQPDITSLERTLITWSDKLDERNEYILSVKYKTLEVDEAVKFDKILAQQSTLIKAYVDLVESVSKEKSQAKTKASAKRSASEKKLI